MPRLLRASTTPRIASGLGAFACESIFTSIASPARKAGSGDARARPRARRGRPRPRAAAASRACAGSRACVAAARIRPPRRARAGAAAVSLGPASEARDATVPKTTRTAGPARRRSTGASPRPTAHRHLARCTRGEDPKLIHNSIEAESRASPGIHGEMSAFDCASPIARAPPPSLTRAPRADSKWDNIEDSDEEGAPDAGAICPVAPPAAAPAAAGDAAADAGHDARRRRDGRENRGRGPRGRAADGAGRPAGGHAERGQGDVEGQREGPLQVRARGPRSTSGSSRSRRSTCTCSRPRACGPR